MTRMVDRRREAEIIRIWPVNESLYLKLTTKNLVIELRNPSHSMNHAKARRLLVDVVREIDNFKKRGPYI